MMYTISEAVEKLTAQGTPVVRKTIWKWVQDKNVTATIAGSKKLVLCDGNQLRALKRYARAERPMGRPRRVRT